MPHLIIIAGPNGAGKTTLAPALLKDTVHINNFVNGVPEDAIRRRYKAGLNNFFKLYQPLADSWQFFNNSDINHPKLIIQGAKVYTSRVENEVIWKQILGTYHEKE